MFEIGDPVRVRLDVRRCRGRFRHDRILPDTDLLHGAHDLSEPGARLVVDAFEPGQETGHTIWASERRADGRLLWRDCFRPEELTVPEREG